jgi:L-arabinonolactonase
MRIRVVNGEEIYVVTGAVVTLGESPVWDVDEERLYWIDVMEGNVFRSTSDGREIRVWQFPGHLTSMVLRSQGGVVLTSGTRLYLFDLDTAESELLFDAEPRPGFSFNDGKVDRQGRFVTGLVDQSLVAPSAVEQVGNVDPPGRLYRLDPDLTVHPFADGIGVTNGPCFSPDGATFYCNDSWARCVYAFDYDPASGLASNRRVLTPFAGDETVPDGATVDEEGFLWIAAYHGGEVRRYAPDGTLDRRISLPVESPTSVAFGGADLDILFVTSHGSAHVPGHTSPSSPLSGSVFALRRLGARGVPERRFAG